MFCVSPEVTKREPVGIGSISMVKFTNRFALRRILSPEDTPKGRALLPVMFASTYPAVMASEREYFAMGSGVGVGDGEGVGVAVGLGEGDGVGDAVGEGVGVGITVGEGRGEIVGVGVGAVSSFDGLK